MLVSVRSLIFLSCALLSGMVCAQDDGEIRVFLPTFEGVGPVGNAVANVLRLQLVQTFRRIDPKRPERGLGWAVLYWQDEPLTEASHREAMRQAVLNMNVLGHLAVWGKAYAYGEGAVVQAYLTLTPLLQRRKPRPERWQLSLQLASETIELYADLPSQHFSFAPIVMSGELLERYRSIEKLPIYADRAMTQSIGRMGDQFLALIVEHDAIKLRSNGIEGWVPLPGLITARSPIVLFTGGLVRVLRGDSRGADELFQALLAQQPIPTNLRIAALLLAGLSEERQGQSGLAMFSQAYALNPLRRDVVQYLVMGKLSQALRDPAQRAARLESAKRLLSDNAFLFDATDPWLRDAKRALNGMLAPHHHE